MTYQSMELQVQAGNGTISPDEAWIWVYWQPTYHDSEELEQIEDQFGEEIKHMEPCPERSRRLGDHITRVEWKRSQIKIQSLGAVDFYNIWPLFVGYMKTRGNARNTPIVIV